MTVVRTSAKGQVVIPAEIRREIGLKPGQRVYVNLEDRKIVLRPIPEDLVEQMTGCLADGPDLLGDLARDHQEELERDDRMLRS